MPFKFQIDGFEVEVADVNTKSVIERAIESAKKDGADKLATERAALADAQAKLTAAVKESADWKAKHDTLDAQVKLADAVMVKCPDCDGEGKIDGQTCDKCEGTGEVKKNSLTDGFAAIVERVASRKADAKAAVISMAREILGEKAKLDGKTVLELKREVVAKLVPTLKLDGKEAEAFVNEAYSKSVASRPARPAAINDARTVTNPVVVPVTESTEVTDAGDARKAMMRRNANALVKK